MAVDKTNIGPGGVEENERRNKIYELPSPIGLPPVEVTKDDGVYTKLRQSLLYVRLVPKLPEFAGDFQLYKLRHAKNEYSKLLGEYGFKYTSERDNGLVLYCLNEGSINDSFNSDYGDSFLENAFNAASSAFLETRQMLGIEDINDLFNTATNMGEALKDKDGGGIIGGIASTAGGALSQISTSVKDFLNKSKNAKVVANTLLGNRSDLPSIWKGSSCNMSYGLTVKLYNPFPNDDAYHMKYIVGPLVALLLFATPVSDDGVTYRWPFYCECNCPGLFRVKNGAITDISITKGGDSSAWTYGQRPYLVEVKLSIQELFNVRVAYHGSSNLGSGIPTLQEYIDNLSDTAGYTNQKYPMHYYPNEQRDKNFEEETKRMAMKANDQQITNTNTMKKALSDTRWMDQPEENWISSVRDGANVVDKSSLPVSVQETIISPPVTPPVTPVTPTVTEVVAKIENPPPSVPPAIATPTNNNNNNNNNNVQKTSVEGQFTVEEMVKQCKEMKLTLEECKKRFGLKNNLKTDIPTSTTPPTTTTPNPVVKTDKDKKSQQHLNKTYGLPPGTIGDSDKVEISMSADTVVNHTKKEIYLNMNSPQLIMNPGYLQSKKDYLEKKYPGYKVKY